MLLIQYHPIHLLSDVIQSGQNLVSHMSGGFFNIFGQAGGIFNVVLIFILSLFFSLTDRGVENFIRIITPLKQERIHDWSFDFLDFFFILSKSFFGE